MSGGYEEGYKQCACFWGTEPGSLTKRFSGILPQFTALKILDAGCGEGKNAAFFAQNGADVRALDISPTAIEHARSTFGNLATIVWEVADIRSCVLNEFAYDIVIAYGLPHCLSSLEDIANTIYRLQLSTRHGGYNILCAFNDRYQELHAHPGFTPTLLEHKAYLDFYAGWEIVYESDENLTEAHPHNNIVHTHSMTRLIAKKNAS